MLKKLLFLTLFLGVCAHATTTPVTLILLNDLSISSHLGQPVQFAEKGSDCRYVGTLVKNNDSTRISLFNKVCPSGVIEHVSYSANLKNRIASGTSVTFKSH